MVIVLVFCAALLALRVLAKKSSLSAIAVVFFLYFYLLHGFVMAVAYSLGYEGIYEKIVFDYPYFIATETSTFSRCLTYNLCFIIFYLLGICVTQSRTSAFPPNFTFRPNSTIAFPGFLPLGGFLLFIVCMILSPILVPAIASGTSAYLDFKNGANLGVWFVPTRLLFDASSMIICAASLDLFTRQSNANTTKTQNPGKLSAVALLTVLFFISILLGDKSSIIAGVIFAFIFIGNSIKWHKLAMIGIPVIAFVNVISLIRHLTLSDLSLSLLGRGSMVMLEHGECTCTLGMYSMVEQNVTFLNGASIISAISGLLPRFLYPDKSMIGGGYETYARLANMADNTGWGITIPTDLYMNFGPIGVCAGGMLYGSLHGSLMQAASTSLRWRFVWAAVFSAWPIMLRGGLTIAPLVYAGVIGAALYCYAARSPFGPSSHTPMKL